MVLLVDIHNFLAMLCCDKYIAIDRLKAKIKKEQVRAKKFVRNKKGDIGMELYYLCHCS